MMNTTSITLPSLLIVLFDLSRAGLSGAASRVADRLGLEEARITRAFDKLERHGLVRLVEGEEGIEARLTMSGLALAVSSDARRQSAPGVVLAA